MKKALVALLTLCLTASTLLSCADPNADNGDSNAGSQVSGTTTVATTAATTIAATTVDRDIINESNTLSEQQIRAKEAIWAAIKNTVSKELTINSVAIGSFIYEFDEAIVCFYYGCPGGYPELMLTEETVLDYQFRYTNTFRLKVFANGQSYSLGSAYSAGVLTEEEIRTLWETYKAEYPGRYDSDEWDE